MLRLPPTCKLETGLAVYHPYNLVDFPEQCVNLNSRDSIGRFYRDAASRPAMEKSMFS
jgi:hypothetical protein